MIEWFHLKLKVEEIWRLFWMDLVGNMLVLGTPDLFIYAVAQKFFGVFVLNNYLNVFHSFKLKW